VKKGERRGGGGEGGGKREWQSMEKRREGNSGSLGRGKGKQVSLFGKIGEALLVSGGGEKNGTRPQSQQTTRRKKGWLFSRGLNLKEETREHLSPEGKGRKKKRKGRFTSSRHRNRNYLHLGNGSSCRIVIRGFPVACGGREGDTIFSVKSTIRKKRHTDPDSVRGGGRKGEKTSLFTKSDSEKIGAKPGITCLLFR